VEPVAVRNALAKIQGVHIGVDVGQKIDFSAIVVAEVGLRPTSRTYVGYSDGVIHAVLESTYRVHEAKRLPLGTPYGGVAHEIVHLASAVWEMEKAMRREGRLTEYERSLDVDIFMDVTGVGAPVYEMVQDELQASPKTDTTRTHPITFTWGDRFNRENGSLGKAYLVSRLQVLMEQERCELPKRNPDIADMVDELKAYEIRITENANDQYGAFIVGTYDDLVTALGLACVEDPNFYSVEIGPNIWG
jgi:hypothetical protein